MKCDCKQCNGTGFVPCDECSGKGQVDVSIRFLPLDKKHPKYDELLALQKHAAALEQKTNELMTLKPGKADSYREQFYATIDKLDEEAEQLLK